MASLIVSSPAGGDASHEPVGLGSVAEAKHPTRFPGPICTHAFKPTSTGQVLLRETLGVWCNNIIVFVAVISTLDDCGGAKSFVAEVGRG